MGRSGLIDTLGGQVLPFLKLNNQSASSGIMTKMRKPDEKPVDPNEEKPNELEEMATEAIEECAKDLLRAIQAQDVKRMAEALRSAFEIADAMPHAEGEHEDNSFKSQNAKAAQEMK